LFDLISALVIKEDEAFLDTFACAIVYFP